MSAGQVVVRGQLADVAVEAGGVEGEHAVGPVEAPRRGGRESAARRWPPCRTRPSCGRRRRSAAPAEPAALQGREEIVDVLAAHHVGDGVRLLAVGAAFADPARRRRSRPGRTVLADRDLAGLGHGDLFGQTRACRAAWPARARTWPRACRTSRGIRGSSSSRRRSPPPGWPTAWPWTFLGRPAPGPFAHSQSRPERSAPARYWEGCLRVGAAWVD